MRDRGLGLESVLKLKSQSDRRAALKIVSFCFSVVCVTTVGNFLSFFLSFFLYDQILDLILDLILDQILDLILF